VRVGLSVEDAAQEGVLRGLAHPWCPDASVFAVRYRGQSKQRRRAELRDDVVELVRRRKCECIAILLDADKRTWREAVDDERGKLPTEPRVPVVIGAPKRNIECWLSADPTHFASAIGGDETQIRRARDDDPKGLVQAAVRQRASADGTSTAGVIEEYTRQWDKRQWLRMKCFNAFYEACQELAVDMGCPPLPNERDAKARDSSA